MTTTIGTRYMQVRRLGVEYSDVVAVLGRDTDDVVQGRRDLTMDELEKLEAVAAAKPREPFNTSFRAAIL
jgi:hypothetical protein